MNNQKFYSFVTDIVKDDPALVESIIEAHKLIFESDELTEGKIGKAIATAGLIGSLMAPAIMAKDYTQQDVFSMGKDTIAQISDEYVENAGDPSFNVKNTKSYKKAMKTYNNILKKDSKLADQYKRMLDQQLNKKLGLNIKF